MVVKFESVVMPAGINGECKRIFGFLRLVEMFSLWFFVFNVLRFSFGE